jgi:hypothetical protein
MQHERGVVGVTSLARVPILGELQRLPGQRQLANEAEIGVVLGSRQDDVTVPIQGSRERRVKVRKPVAT